jgi:hypothetical protein
MTEDIRTYDAAARNEFLNKAVGQEFMAEVITAGRFAEGWKILRRSPEESTILNRDQFPYALVEADFSKLIVYAPDAEGVLEMAQRVWTAVFRVFGIRMETGNFTPLE